MLLHRTCVLAVLTLSLGSAITIAAPNPSQAQTISQNMERPNRPERGEPRWIQELNLTPDQVQRMQAIRDRYKDQMNQRHQALRQAQQEMRQLMAGNATAAQIREKHRQVEALRQQVDEMRFESMLEMREVLTTEQRRQFAENMERRRETRRDRMRNSRGHNK